MCNFGTLLKYEYKKILKRKITWITFGVLLLASVAVALSSGLTASVSEGTFFENVARAREDGKKITGRRIDESLLKEYSDSRERLPDGVEYFLYLLVGGKDVSEITEKELYESREAMLQQEWSNKQLTEGEKGYLIKQEEQTDTPIVYKYCEGLKKVLAIVYVIGIMQVMFAAICVPIIVADEHSNKMDQLNLSSRLGRRTLLMAKIAAGITLMAAVTVLFLLAAAIPTLYIYGADGFTTQIQLIYPQFSLPLTVGQVLLRMIALSLLIAVLQAVAAMFLAERLHSSVGAMAVMIGVLILTLLIGMPEEHRVISQLWNLIPSNITGIWAFLDSRLVPAFGRYFTQWQAASGIYVILIILGSIGTCRAYHKYQISG